MSPTFRLTYSLEVYHNEVCHDEIVKIVKFHYISIICMYYAIWLGFRCKTSTNSSIFLNNLKYYISKCVFLYSRYLASVCICQGLHTQFKNRNGKKVITTTCEKCSVVIYVIIIQGGQIVIYSWNTIGKFLCHF